MNALKKILATFALLFLTVSPISPASAHTEIDHTSPSDGSSVAAGVQTVSVFFTNKILNIADSSEIAITDSEGNVVETSCVEVSKTSLNAEAYFGTEGEYLVVWRTVAEDGHPISGKFSFTVTGTADKSNFVNCKQLASQGNVVIATPKAEPLAGQDDLNSKTTDTGIVWPFWAAGFVLLIAWLVFQLRRQRTKG